MKGPSDITFEGVDREQRDEQIWEAKVEPLKISVGGFTSLGVLTLKLNREMSLKRRKL